MPPVASQHRFKNRCYPFEETNKNILNVSFLGILCHFQPLRHWLQIAGVDPIHVFTLQYRLTATIGPAVLRNQRPFPGTRLDFSVRFRRVRQSNSMSEYAAEFQPTFGPSRNSILRSPSRKVGIRASAIDARGGSCKTSYCKKNHPPISSGSI
jgi:hypothetical protein